MTLVLKMRCTGDTISGDGRKNVVLQPGTLSQPSGVTVSDDLRFVLDPSSPYFDDFVKNKDHEYQVTIF